MLLTALLLLVLTPSPSPSPVPAWLSVQIGQVNCTDRSLDVVITNPDRQRAQTYSLFTDTTFQRSEEVPPGTTLRSKVVLKADGSTVVKVVENGRTLASESRTAECAVTPSPAPTVTQGGAPPPATPAPGPTQPRQPAKNLPFTGPGDMLRAHTFTGLAVMAGGGILVFYALLWPRGGSGDWPCPIRRTR